MWLVFSKCMAWDVHRTAEHTRELQKIENTNFVWVRVLRLWLIFSFILLFLLYIAFTRRKWTFKIKWLPNDCRCTNRINSVIVLYKVSKWSSLPAWGNLSDLVGRNQQPCCPITSSSNFCAVGSGHHLQLHNKGILLTGWVGVGILWKKGHLFLHPKAQSAVKPDTKSCSCHLF